MHDTTVDLWRLRGAWTMKSLVRIPLALLCICLPLCCGDDEQIPLVDNGAQDHPLAESFENSSWTLTSTRFVPNKFQHRPYVANGYFGQNLPAEGVGYWADRNHSDGCPAINGWPLDQPRATFGTINGFWGLIPKVTRPILDENVRRGWESVISGMPDWTGLVVTSQSQHYRPGVDPESVEHYHQSFNFRNGVVRTNVTWRPSGEQVAYQLNYTVLAHQARPHLGVVRLDISSTEAARISITDVLDGAGATRAVYHRKKFEDTDALIWTSVRPDGIENITAYQSSTVKIRSDRRDVVRSTRHDATEWPWISQNTSTIAQSWVLDISEGETVSVFKYVGTTSNEAFPESALAAATTAALQAKEISWERLLNEHMEAWEKIWNGLDIVIPGNNDLTILARTSIFHLMANLRPESELQHYTGNSVMVGGLSSDSYAGLIFWDADTWMYPSLLLLRPDYARNINAYRQVLLKQAIANAQLYNYSGALYPWTSARYGNCTGTGLCQHYQYHLNSDIALSHWQYYLQTRDRSWLAASGWPVIKEVADMFAGFVKRNASRNGQYETIRMGEPDEYVWNVNNGAYTNSGIKKLLGEWAPLAVAELGLDPPSNWSNIAENIVIPYDPDENLVHEYDDMPGTIQIKQASVVLLNYPLNYRIGTKQAVNDLELYGPVTSPNGPAMTWSVFAISEAQLQASGCAAYTYLQRSYEPYLRGPFYQFSEQIDDDPRANGGISPAFPFLTGNGGFLQILTHGFTGFRFDKDAFVLDPMLPPHLPDGIVIRGMQWQGSVFDVDIQLGNTTISRKPGKTPVHKQHEYAPVRITGPHTPQVEYHLRIDESLTVPTRRPDLNRAALQGNLAQCARVLSTTPHVPGHIPLAVVDGTNATVWQPLTALEPAQVTIDLGQSSTVRGFTIVWGNAPPDSFTVLVDKPPVDDDLGWNEHFQTVYHTDQVAISSPYRGPGDARLVKRRTANSTTHIFSTHYEDIHLVKLVVLGTQANDKKVGATVAEIAVL